MSLNLNYNKYEEYEGIENLFNVKVDPLLVRDLDINIKKLVKKKTNLKLAKQYGLTWEDIKKNKLYSIERFTNYIKNREYKPISILKSGTTTTLLVDKGERKMNIIKRIRELSDYKDKTINMSISRQIENSEELENFTYIKKTSLENVEGFSKLISGFFAQYRDITEAYITIDLAEVVKPNTDEYKASDSNDNYNCALKIISKSLNIDFPKFFSNYPKFDGRFDKKTPHIKLIEFEQICKKEGVRVLLYSKLGELINKPFRQINKLKSNYSVNVDIVLHGGHAYQKFKDSGIVNVVRYVEDSLDTLYPYMDNQIINYKKGMFVKYIDEDRNITMVKKFKPSYYTKDTLDDNNNDYFNCFSVESFYFKKWVNENKLKCINSSFIEDIIKEGCHTIGCYSFDLPIPENKDKLYEIDHNRSYSYYRCKKNQFYCGVPLSNLEIYKWDINIDLYADNVAFIIPSRIELPKFSFPIGELFKVLSRPMYQFLISIGAIIEVQAVLFSDFMHLTDQPISLNGDVNHKLMHNTHIGKLIQGGIKQEQQIEISDFNEDEEKLIKYELNKYNIPFDMPVLSNTIKCKIPYKKQYYHVYSYIVQYSQISIISKMLELQKLGCTVYGGNCDSIIFDKFVYSPSMFVNDEFKIEKLNDRKYTRIFETNEKKNHNYEFLDLQDLRDKPMLIKNRLIINGCAGSGKSYEFIKKSDPRSTVILSPTLQRMRENSNLNKNSTTIQKIIKNPFNKLDVTKIIIDEFLMMDLDELNIIKNYADKFGINLVMLGHHCQLSKNFGDSKPIKISKLDDFIIHNFERGPISRQKCPKLIELLDSFTWGLQDKPNFESMKEKLNNFTNVTYEHLNTLIKNNILDYVFISEKHDHINYLNKQFKPLLEEIPCVIQKGKRENLGKIINVKISDNNIDWSRMSMHDKKEAIYEPRLIRTVYSVQGDTIEENKKLVIFKNYITSCNSLYTAITRIKTKEQLIIVCNDNEIIKPTKEERLKRYQEQSETKKTKLKHLNHDLGSDELRNKNRQKYDEIKYNLIQDEINKEINEENDDLIDIIMTEYYNDELINMIMNSTVSLIN